MVDPALFADTMEAKFRSYGNVTSPALRRAWARMAEIFNAELVRDDGGPRPVIPAELGAGKTTAAKLWCAMLPYADHPGVLVVVRTIEAAKEFAADVNAWADVPITAYAYHHEVPRDERDNLDALAWFPVLVICHRAYELSLDPFAVVASRASFEKVHAFRAGGRRRMVIVDEALDQVHEARISRAGLQRAMSYIPSAITRKHNDAMDALDSVARALRNAPEDRQAGLSVKELLSRVPFAPDEADARLMAMWDDVRLNRMKPENRLVIGEAVSSVRRHLFSYRWTNGEGPRNTAITGGRLLLPPEAALVVLDATGRLNSVYTGRPDYYRVEPMGQVRRYENVTIHHARTRGTGKMAMLARGDEIALQTLDASDDPDDATRRHHRDEGPGSRARGRDPVPAARGPAYERPGPSPCGPGPRRGRPGDGAAPVQEGLEPLGPDAAAQAQQGLEALLLHPARRSAAQKVHAGEETPRGQAQAEEGGRRLTSWRRASRYCFGQLPIA